ncbi:FMN-binding protein [Paenibacillus thalictri]|uniref:FMN-binding protein n=1 Tax=Paenibacillus thalictri TaxID=2527873 RepID=A0A4V2J3Z8_9BACL|nr:FMN-binding protein [Paenibacillus thalictri]TBL76455.1 FMN-binding protein [Paenibacillus thalictri]
MAKMNKKWVALCSSAIGAIYAAGYFVTETEASIPQPPPQQIQASAQSNGELQHLRHDKDHRRGQNGLNQDRQQEQSRQQQSRVQNSPQSKNTYKDGTYQGSGSNRRGSIQVAVTVKNNKISDVEISRFAMHYSKKDVEGLPEEVIQNQSAQVRNVSGATYSTQAFKDAVQNALEQALTS